MVTLSANPLPRSTLVKILVWVNCAALIVGGLLAFIGNILSFLDPTLPVLAFYIFIFGCIALTGELGLGFSTKYFGYLHDWIGEAAFFIFVGTFGISFGTDSIIALIVGIFSCVVGLLCIADHFVWGRNLINRNTPASVPPAASTVEAAVANTAAKL